MKNYIHNKSKIIFNIIFIIVSLPFCRIQAQDKIYKTDNNIIEAKVIEITSTDIKYKKFSNPNGPTYTISKTEVQMIVYENGEKEVYNKEKDTQTKPIEKVATIDSLSCIENALGLKLENSFDFGGGIKVTKLVDNSIFVGQTAGAFGSKLDNKVICYISTDSPVRVVNTSELTKTLFNLYSNGISKVELLGGKSEKFSKFSKKNGIDISGLALCQGLDTITNKKLGITESENAGKTVASIYLKGKNWSLPGVFFGILAGVAGIGLVGIAAGTSPAKKGLTNAPPSVDAEAWTKGFKTQVRLKRFKSGLIGGAIGTAFMVILVSLK